MIQIDKGIPLPPRKYGREGGFATNYPWRTMEVGDSFLVEGRAQNSVAAHASLAAKRYARTFTTRKEPGGVRVWRVA